MNASAKKSNAKLDEKRENCFNPFSLKIFRPKFIRKFPIWIKDLKNLKQVNLPSLSVMLNFKNMKLYERSVQVFRVIISVKRLD